MLTLKRHRLCTASRGPWAVGQCSLQAHTRDDCSRGHNGASEGQSASGLAEGSYTHGHPPRAFRITRLEKKTESDFPRSLHDSWALFSWALFSSLQELGCWRQALGLLAVPSLFSHR